MLFFRRFLFLFLLFSSLLDFFALGYPDRPLI
jgi:hypothetical protein